MQFLPLLLAVVGAVVVGLSAVYFLRARSRETFEHGASSPVAEEVKAIGTQITAALSEQRLQGETQRQLLAQKLDSVRQSVDAQRSHVDGLRGELRHEVRRRDAEMDELRSQIGSIRSAVALPPAGQTALPPAAPPEPVHETTLAQEPPPVQEAPAPVMPPSPEPATPETAVQVELAPAREPGVQADEPTPVAAMPPQAPEDPFGAMSFGDSVSTGPAASPFGVFEMWTPDAAPTPAQTEPAQATFEDVAFHSDATPTGTAAPTRTASAPSPAPLAEAVETAPAGEPHPEAAPETQQATPEDQTFEDAAFEDVAFEEATFETAAFEDVTLDENAFDDVFSSLDVPPAVPSVSEIDPSWIARPDRPDPSVTAEIDRPVFASVDDFFSASTSREEPAPSEPGEGLIDLSALVGAGAPEPPSVLPGPPPEIAEPAATAPEPLAPEPAAVPEGADDLTVISSIDEHVQRLLYAEGIVSLEDIAQWNRTRARQIAIRVQVSEETIMNQWVFEAQAAMFNQFANQSGL